VRFWDLRYADDSRTVRAGEAFAMPLPDQVAVNGRVAWNAFAASGYDDDRLVAVEALRYQHLAGSPSRPAAVSGPIRRVLILGDFRASATARMLGCVDAAFGSQAVRPAFVLRSHPAARIDRSMLSPIVELSDRPLPELMAESDAVFASNTTSAGLDAYLAGLPVIVFLNDEGLNVSPLRGVEGVPFVSDGPQFAGALAQVRGAADSGAAEVFWIDPRLPRWRGLFAQAGLTVG
jgi:surface carbohydrate biosynthesis protein (TIGR04326 family)